MFRILFLFFNILFLFPVMALADPIERQPVNQRVHEGFEVPGTRLGDLMIHPSAKVMEIFNDNIYATDAIKRSDFITNVSPKITARTLNRNHGFKAEISSDHAFYNRNTRENYTDFKMSLMPYLQVTRASKLDAKIAYEREHDARTAEASSNNIGAEEPVRWNRTIGRLGWQYKPNRTGLNSFVQHAKRRYENVAALNGGPIFINNDRDRNEDEAGIELSHDLTDRNKIFAAMKGINRNYERRDFITTAYTGLNRDSKAYDLRVGSNFDLTDLIRINLDGGFYSQNFSDSGFKNIQTFVTSAKATWQITGLTTLDFGAKREVFETIQPDASAFIQNAVTAQLSHELRRNILVGVEAASGTNSYTGGSRKDDFWGIGPNLVYKMNRNIDWKAGYLFDARQSNQPNADYDRQRVFVGMQVKF